MSNLENDIKITEEKLKALKAKQELINDLSIITNCCYRLKGCNRTVRIQGMGDNEYQAKSNILELHDAPQEVWKMITDAFDLWLKIAKGGQINGNIKV